VCGWPRLPVYFSSLDLSIEFGEAGIAILIRRFAAASLMRRVQHAILL
jgi:hypothetical protein